MFDVYDNLENYDEVNSFEQIKSENKDLKCKLEQYKTALCRLQKDILQDFDNLTCQHQQLLANYSSLLKTARAEVERKTEAISNINREKDKIFLRLLSDKTNKNMTKGAQKKSPRKNNNKRKAKIRKKEESLHELTDSKLDLRNSVTCVDSHSERKDNAPVTLNNSSCVLNDHSTHKKDVPDLRMVLEGKVKNKENQKSHDELHSSYNIKQKISQPNLRHELPKFSSEEEDAGSSTTTRSIPPRDNIEPAMILYSDDKFKNRPDNYLDDKYTDQRDRPRNCRDEMYSSDKYRQSRYEESFKYRDSRSRGRSYSGRDRGRNDDIRYRNRSRPRERDSPPHDRYQRNKSRDRRFYDRERPDHEFDRHKPANHDKQAVKHKMRPDIEESSNKRRKIDSYRNEDERYRHDRVHVQQNLPEFVLHSEFTSCQSPDEIHVEQVAMTQPIKEIMYTAETPQEDPRKKSTRYIPVGEGKNKVWMSESATQIKLNKVGPWSSDDQEIQKQQHNQDFVSQIYMDIDNACSELESGEINDLDIYSDILPNTDVYEVINEPKITDYPVVTKTNNEASTSRRLIIPQEQSIEMEKKYKIPKSNKTETTTQVYQNKISNSIQNISKLEKPLQSEKKTSGSALMKPLDLLVKEMNSQESVKASYKHSHDAVLPQKLSISDEIKKDVYIEAKKNLEGISNKNKPLKVSRLNTPAKKTIVAGDLELSEESSDSNEEPSRVVKQKNESASKKDRDNNNQKVTTKKHKNSEEQNKQEHIKKDDSKTKEINAKFSDLFGDSSLLMPEDLNLPSTQVFDDCSEFPPSPPELSPNEMANDVCDHTNKNTAIENLKILSSQRKKGADDKKQDKKADKRISKKKLIKNDREKQIILENIKKPVDKIKDDDKNKYDKITLDDPIVPIDTKTGPCIRIIPSANTIEQDVYKTVIISTGQQPDSSTTTNTTETSNTSEDKSKSEAEIENHPKETLKSSENLTRTSKETFSTFATSTPERCLRNISLESRSNGTENNISDTAQDVTDKDTSSNQSLQINPSSAPDVRVMLKRRKKRIVK